METDVEKIAQSINKSYYVIAVRIHALNDADFRSMDKSNKKKLIEFNDKLSRRLERFCFDHPLKCYILNEPDYFLCDEANEHLVKMLTIQYKYNDTLKHLWEQLFAAVVAIEDNKALLESLNTNKGFKWYLYSINLLYKNMQRTILLIQKLKPGLLSSIRYEKLKITEVKIS